MPAKLSPPKDVATINRQLIALSADRLQIPLADRLSWYISQYNAGWAASRRYGRGEVETTLFDTGGTTHAWDDGYLDQAAGREKWHLAHCKDHDECGEA